MGEERDITGSSHGSVMSTVNNEIGNDDSRNNITDHSGTDSYKTGSCRTVDMKALLLMMNYSEDDFIINISLGEGAATDG